MAPGYLGRTGIVYGHLLSMKNCLDFCCFSGMLGPTAKSCEEEPLDLDENSFSFRFGPALRASFVRSEIKWEGEGVSI
ncbi:hypothetical protein J1N35_015615 [Gossypium stocksii]|uniref:Uncharacterized protein n=1 Tax=Gossypium stocksii TaxID=47602 RepID=A0A9D3VYP2_9ROSI|nr:hypothetical protein J1N35_015615 [Gossypium stocksii]